MTLLFGLLRVNLKLFIKEKSPKIGLILHFVFCDDK